MMKKKLLLAFGLLFFISAGLGLSLAHHSTADNHTDNHDHHYDDFVDKIWDWHHGGGWCDLHNQEDHCFSRRQRMSYPIPYLTNYRRTNWVRAPRIQPRVYRPNVIQQPTIVREPVSYSYSEPVYQEPYTPNFYGHIRSENSGSRINFYVDQSASANWEWHYNSHAVNCEIIQGNNLSCWVINPAIPSEVWAEFFIQDAYNRNQTFKSNVINI